MAIPEPSNSDQHPARSSSTSASQPAFTFAQDWTSYHAHRPEYPAKLYELLFAYHEKHSSRLSASSSPSSPSPPSTSSSPQSTNPSPWNTALDLGTGGGIVAATLLSRFQHVIGLDPSAHHLSSADRLLRAVVAEQASSQTSPHSSSHSSSHPSSHSSQPSSSPSPSRYRLIQSSAELLNSHVAYSSMDMITIGEALHWTEHSQVVPACATALKPGGTFAAWWYSPRVRVSHSPAVPGTDRARELIDRIFETWQRRAAGDIGSDKLARATAMTNAGLRSVGFDEELWMEGVQRLEWVRAEEWERGLSGFEGGREVERVGRGDLVVEYLRGGGGAGEKEMESIVRKDGADIDWIKGYMANLWQDMEFNGRDDVRALYEELEEVLEGMGGRVALVWPFLLVMATRR